MKFGRRSKRTTIIFDEGDLTEFLAEGTISGRSKGQNFTITCPPTSVGISEKQYQNLIEKIKSQAVIIDDLELAKKNIGQTRDELLLETSTLKRRIEVLQKKYGKLLRINDDLDKTTIPIDEHQDLMNAKIESHNQVVEALEEAQAVVVNQLDDEIGELQNKLQQCQNDLAGCENEIDKVKAERDQNFDDLGDCEEKLLEME